MTERSRSIEVSLLVLSVIATGVCMYVLRDLLIPMAFAAFLAVLFRPLTDIVRKLHAPTWIALILVIAISAGALWGIIAIVGVGVDSATVKAPIYAEKAQRLFDSAQRYVAEIPGSHEMMKPIEDAVTPQALIQIVTSSLGSVISTLGDGVLMLLYLVFIILGSGVFPQKLDAAVAASRSDYLAHIYETVNDKVLRYLRIKTLFNLLTALVTYGVLTAFEVDFAPVIALLAFFFTYLPNIGSFITVVLTGLVSLVQFEDPGYALLIVAILVVLSNIIGNVLEPKAMGHSLDLSPLVVLISMIFWGWMWGIIGMILSVPIMAVVKVVLEQFPTTQPLAILMGSAAPASNDKE